MRCKAIFSGRMREDELEDNKKQVLGKSRSLTPNHSLAHIRRSPESEEACPFGTCNIQEGRKISDKQTKCRHNPIPKA